MKPQPVASAQARHVTKFQILAYVLPAMPLAALILPVVVHLPQFYASKGVGLSLAVTGLIFSLCRIADVFIDPVMGYVSDRLTTRWGRRRPLVVVGTPVLTLGIWMVFVPGGPVSPLHLAFWLSVMYLGYSMVTIPHLSWGAELTTDYHERSRVYGWSQVSTIVGMMTVLTLPAILQYAGGYSLNWQIMAMALFAILTLAPSVALCAGVLPEPEVKLATHAPLIPTFKFLLKDKALRRVIALDLFASTNAGAVGAMFFFFARFGLGLGSWSNIILLTYFISSTICIPFWIWLSRRIGKHRALTASFAFTIAAVPLLLLIQPGQIALAIPLFALAGNNSGAATFLLRSMMADVADADSAANNAERAGLMYSFLALTAKFGAGAAVGISFGALAWIGFDPKSAVPGEAVLGLKEIYISLPIIFSLINLAILRGYPLDEVKQRQIRAEVERRRAQHQSADDVMPRGTASAGPATGLDPEAIADIGDPGIEERPAP